MEFDSPLPIVAGIIGFVAGLLTANRAGLGVVMQIIAGLGVGVVGFLIGMKQDN